MNLQNIFSEIENVDAEVYDRMDTRRSAMKQFANFTGKAALAAMPLALGSMFKKAYGQTPNDVLDVLQFALTLEYLEASFYTQGVASPAVAGNAAVSPAALGALQKIRDHENAHVQYLRAVITSTGNTPVSFTNANFDFTGGATTVSPNIGNGPFKGWNADYDIFLAVSQTLEDTGVRAYKGQAGRLINNKPVLTAALNIHSVEARHASHIRQMRRARALVSGAFTAAYVGNIKPWIEQKQSNIGGNNPVPGAGNASFAAAVQGNYDGEETTNQLGVNILSINGDINAATASFDEPLTKAQVLNLIDGFVI